MIISIYGIININAILFPYSSQLGLKYLHFSGGHPLIWHNFPNSDETVDMHLPSLADIQQVSSLSKNKHLPKQNEQLQLTQHLPWHSSAL
jgi:hypothetical protein